MRMTIILGVVAAQLLCLEVAFGCGDSLHRVGKGVAYRNYSAPIPGNILILAETTEAQSLAAGLAAAGHHVTTATSASTLSNTAKTADFDVIIAGTFAHDAIDVIPQSTRLLVATGRSEAAQMKRDYPYVVRNDQSLKHYLKAIHKIVTAQQR